MTAHSTSLSHSLAAARRAFTTPPEAARHADTLYEMSAHTAPPQLAAGDAAGAPVGQHTGLPAGHSAVLNEAAAGSGPAGQGGSVGSDTGDEPQCFGYFGSSLGLMVEEGTATQWDATDLSGGSADLSRGAAGLHPSGLSPSGFPKPSSPKRHAVVHSTSPAAAGGPLHLPWPPIHPLQKRFVDALEEESLQQDSMVAAAATTGHSSYLASCSGGLPSCGEPSSPLSPMIKRFLFEDDVPPDDNGDARAAELAGGSAELGEEEGAEGGCSAAAGPALATEVAALPQAASVSFAPVPEATDSSFGGGFVSDLLPPQQLKRGSRYGSLIVKTLPASAGRLGEVTGLATLPPEEPAAAAAPPAITARERKKGRSRGSARSSAAALAVKRSIVLGAGNPDDGDIDDGQSFSSTYDDDKDEWSRTCSYASNPLLVSALGRIHPKMTAADTNGIQASLQLQHQQQQLQQQQQHQHQLEQQRQQHEQQWQLQLQQQQQLQWMQPAPAAVALTASVSSHDRAYGAVQPGGGAAGSQDVPGGGASSSPLPSSRCSGAAGDEGKHREGWRVWPQTHGCSSPPGWPSAAFPVEESSYGDVCEVTLGRPKAAAVATAAVAEASDGGGGAGGCRVGTSSSSRSDEDRPVAALPLWLQPLRTVVDAAKASPPSSSSEGDRDCAPLSPHEVEGGTITVHDTEHYMRSVGNGGKADPEEEESDDQVEAPGRPAWTPPRSLVIPGQRREWAPPQGAGPDPAGPAARGQEELYSLAVKAEAANAQRRAAQAAADDEVPDSLGSDSHKSIPTETWFEEEEDARSPQTSERSTPTSPVESQDAEPATLGCGCLMGQGNDASAACQPSRDRAAAPAAAGSGWGPDGALLQKALRDVQQQRQQQRAAPTWAPPMSSVGGQSSHLQGSVPPGMAEFMLGYDLEDAGAGREDVGPDGVVVAGSTLDEGSTLPCFSSQTRASYWRPELMIPIGQDATFDTDEDEEGATPTFIPAPVRRRSGSGSGGPSPMGSGITGAPRSPSLFQMPPPLMLSDAVWSCSPRPTGSSCCVTPTGSNKTIRSSPRGGAGFNLSMHLGMATGGLFDDEDSDGEEI